MWGWWGRPALLAQCLLIDCRKRACTHQVDNGHDPYHQEGSHDPTAWNSNRSFMYMYTYNSHMHLSYRGKQMKLTAQNRVRVCSQVLSKHFFSWPHYHSQVMIKCRTCTFRKYVWVIHKTHMVKELSWQSPARNEGYHLRQVSCSQSLFADLMDDLPTYPMQHSVFLFIGNTWTAWCS